MNSASCKIQNKHKTSCASMYKWMTWIENEENNSIYNTIKENKILRNNKTKEGWSGKALA
jgi:hypothetical protein